MLADAFEGAQTRTASKVVLGVNLKPRHFRSGVRHQPLMRKTQSDPGVGEDRTALRAAHRLSFPVYGAGPAESRGGGLMLHDAFRQLDLMLPPAILAQTP